MAVQADPAQPVAQKGQGLLQGLAGVVARTVAPLSPLLPQSAVEEPSVVEVLGVSLEPHTLEVAGEPPADTWELGAVPPEALADTGDRLDQLAPWVPASSEVEPFVGGEPPEGPPEALGTDFDTEPGVPDCRPAVGQPGALELVLRLAVPANPDA